MELLECYLPVFKRVTEMISDPQQFTDYEQSRQGCTDVLEQAHQSASLQDVSEDEKEASHLAVVAWLDESILRSGLPWRQHWQGELLQRKYLQITVAGERFFTRLAQLEPSQQQAHEVFLFCLQNGFQGQYSTDDDMPALQAVIGEQRSLCLPEEWLHWPNDAAITPSEPSQPVVPTFRKSPYLRMAIGISLLYGMLFFILYHYVA
ncbi:DotU family type IV/VI secretion system protein [Buttiauxella ferragutiae]|uniref:DotU family type IV/VI secretion system protein n=1 Tax=Buttiauxella ferragutiae TaxID=82989 RepID=UPI0035250A17